MPRRFLSESGKAIQKILSRDSSVEDLNISNEIGSCTACELPVGVERLHWMKVNLIDFYNQTNLIVGGLSEICTEETCPRTLVGADGNSFEYRVYNSDPSLSPSSTSKLISIPAVEYAEYILAKIHDHLINVKTTTNNVQMKNNDINNNGGDIERRDNEVGQEIEDQGKEEEEEEEGRDIDIGNSEQRVKDMYKGLFRIYAHLISCHLQDLVDQGAEELIRPFVLHLVNFINDFNLVRKEDLVVLAWYFVDVVDISDAPSQSTSTDSDFNTPSPILRRSHSHAYDERISLTSESEKRRSSPLSEKHRSWREALRIKRKSCSKCQDEDMHNMSFFTMSNADQCVSTFGVQFTELMKASRNEHSFVPLFLKKCFDFITSHDGLTKEGIFRISGSSSGIQRLKQAFDNQPDVIDLESTEWKLSSVHTIAGLTKLFFRELPEPLLTFDLYDEVLELASILDAAKTATENVDLVVRLLRKLEPCNIYTLCYTVRFLCNIVDHSDVNQMSAHNISLCMSPSLIRSTDTSASKLMRDSSSLTLVLSYMIENFKDIFKDLCVLDESGDPDTTKSTGAASAVAVTLDNNCEKEGLETQC